MLASFDLHHIVLTDKDHPRSVIYMLPHIEGVHHDNWSAIRMTWLEVLRQEKDFQNQVNYKVYVAMLSLGRQYDEIYDNPQNAKKGQQMVYFDSSQWNKGTVQKRIDENAKRLHAFAAERRFNVEAVQNHWDLIQLLLISCAVIPDYGGYYDEARTLEHRQVFCADCKSVAEHWGDFTIEYSRFETPCLRGSPGRGQSLSSRRHSFSC